MADEPDVQAPEITPEDFDGEQETPKAEPSSVKEEAKAESEDKPEVKGEEEKASDPPAVPDIPTKGEEAKPDEAEEPEGQPETPEDKPIAKADEPNKVAEQRKTELNTEIRDLVSRRNALKEQVAKANEEVYQPATEDELVEQGLTATDAKVEALRQEIEVSKYNEKVADAQLTIGHESERVLNDFPIFNPDSTEYDKELAEEAAGLLQANLIFDPNTQQVIGSNVSPYQLYKTLARASGISVTKGQIKGQQDTEQMLANADSGSSAAPAKQKVDPLNELWAEPL